MKRVVAAVYVAVALAACTSGEGTQQVKPLAKEPQIAGDAGYEAALRAYGHFDPAAADKLRATLQTNPQHPRALALALFTNLPGKPNDALSRANQLLAAPPADIRPTDAVLLRAAVAFRKHGAPAGQQVLAASSVAPDHETVYWTAILAYRAGHYADANRHLFQLLQSQHTELRGRIFDRYTRVLLYFDDGEDALSVARDYQRLVPSSAAAARLVVRALIATGAVDEAQQALAKVAHDDRLAGLHGRLAANRGQFAEAARNYLAAATSAPAARRVYYLAAAALCHQLAGDTTAVASDLDRCDKAERNLLCGWLRAVVGPKPASQEETLRRAAGGAIDAPLVGILRAAPVMAPIGCVTSSGAPVRATANPGVLSVGATISTLLNKRSFVAARWLPLFEPLVHCYRAAVEAQASPEQAASTLAPVAKRHPVFALALARIQAAFDPAAAIKVLDRAAKAASGTAQARALEALRRQLVGLNAKPPHTN